MNFYVAFHIITSHEIKTDLTCNLLVFAHSRFFRIFLYSVLRLNVCLILMKWMIHPLQFIHFQMRVNME